MGQTNVRFPVVKTSVLFLTCSGRDWSTPSEWLWERQKSLCLLMSQLHCWDMGLLTCFSSGRLTAHWADHLQSFFRATPGIFICRLQMWVGSRLLCVFYLASWTRKHSIDIRKSKVKLSWNESYYRGEGTSGDHLDQHPKKFSLSLQGRTVSGLSAFPQYDRCSGPLFISVVLSLELFQFVCVCLVPWSPELNPAL